MKNSKHYKKTAFKFTRFEISFCHPRPTSQIMRNTMFWQLNLYLINIFICVQKIYSNKNSVLGTILIYLQFKIIQNRHKALLQKAQEEIEGSSKNNVSLRATFTDQIKEQERILASLKEVRVIFDNLNDTPVYIWHNY